MQAKHTLAAAIVCALALVACKETPPPNEKTAMTTEKTATTTPEATSPISSPALPGPAASDATPGTPATPGPSENAPQKPTGDETKAPSTAIDSPATNPMGTLSKDDEQTAMPLAGHGNNHSSPSIEPPRKE
jgi:hypothetical protein